jgi:hypothetical protein
MSEIPDVVVQAQRAMDAAWAELEAYRKAVDADRRKTAQPATEGHRSPALRPWTEAEDARYAELHAAAVAAAEHRAAVMREHGVTSTWDTERAVRAAARGE